MARSPLKTHQIITMVNDSYSGSLLSYRSHK